MKQMKWIWEIKIKYVKKLNDEMGAKNKKMKYEEQNYSK